MLATTLRAAALILLCTGITYGAPGQAKNRVTAAKTDAKHAKADEHKVVPAPQPNTAPAVSIEEQQQFIANLGERLTALEEKILGLQHPLEGVLERTGALEIEVFGGTLSGDRTPIVERISKLETAAFKNASKDSHNLPDGMSTFVDSRKEVPRSSGKLRN